MRVFAAVALTVLTTVSPSAVVASSRTPAEATAHALSELANCHAQARPECPTETPTPVPTVTFSPTPTSTPRPTDTPVPTPTASPVATAEPCWLVDQDLGDPSNGYVVFDQDGAPVPCSIDDPLPVATDTPTPAPTPESTSTPAPTRAPVIQPPAAAAREVIVVQTVVVIVTAIPAETPTPRPVTATPTSSTTRTATATPRRTPTATPTPTPSAVLVAGVSATRPPTGASSHVSAPAPGHWDWSSFLRTLAGVVLVGGILIWLAMRRKVVVWQRRRTHA